VGSPEQTVETFMSEEKKSQRPVTDAIQVIVEEGRQVRDRIKKIVASSVADEEFSIGSLGRAARNVMLTAYGAISKTVEKTVPRDQESVLRDVVYGIGDAFGAAAKSAGAAFESATKHGKEFASEDVKRVTAELKGLASTLVDTVRSSGKSAVGHAADLTKSASHHAVQVAEEIKPSVEKALSAAAQHPVRLTQEAAKAGFDVSRQVAGSLFEVLGEMMIKAADAMKGESPDSEDKAPDSEDRDPAAPGTPTPD
jgi:hypothetical protein